MRANELMLDDWVECLDSTHKEKVFAQVDAIEESRNCLLVKDGWGNWFLDISHLEPIPLTEEILVKISDFTVRGEYVISGVNRYPYARIAWSRDKEKFYFSTLGSNCYLDYVHQLQHLLRLTGIEKEIEL